MKSLKRLTILLSVLLILFVILAFGFYNGLQCTTYTYYSKRIPSDFDGFRIVQLSDLHCKYFGDNQSKLITAVRKLSPDVIFFTGDMIDGDHSSIMPVSDLLDGISTIAPIYAVSGNHEGDSTNMKAALNQLYRKHNVTVLNNSSVSIMNGDSEIKITGSDNALMPNNIPFADTNQFNILLYHYSNLFRPIAVKNYDLVFSGHTHGGIIRLPIIGGLIANDLSLFSEFDSGMYTIENSTLISSRGLGDASIPRFNNRPEVILTILKTNFNEN